MFPNVRLLIAAILASVVALSCGFGVFAAFRVNHEPFVRLPPATAPLQLIAAGTITPAVMVAEADPVDHRFRISPPQIGQAANSPREPGDRDGVEGAAAVLAAAPERGAAEAHEIPAVAQSAEPAAVAPTSDAPAAPAATAPIANIVAPNVDDHALGTAEPKPAHADAALPPQETPAVAVLDPPPNHAFPGEQTKPDSELAPATITTALPEPRPRLVRKAAMSRIRHKVARIYSQRWAQGNAVAQFDTQYFNQGAAFSRPNFQTAAPAPQPRLTQRHHRRAKVASGPPEDQGSAIGGPFVSPPAR